MSWLARTRTHGSLRALLRASSSVHDTWASGMLTAEESAHTDPQPPACQQQRRWMAVPKRKTTPHRRGMRNRHKGMPAVENVAMCSKCQRIMGMHDIPHYFCKLDDCPSRWQKS